jgi:aspartate carbamoyltransferase catalytic subunit
MMNLLTMEQLSVEAIYALISSAFAFKEGKEDTTFKGKIVANLFFEPSTRTHYSFITAQEKLDMKVINFNASTSSVVKGESFYDTVKTFESLGVDLLVIRSQVNRYFDYLKSVTIPIINAGDGTQNHPSQSLLDLFTIYEEFGYFQGLKIAIVGDIKHSRVAHSNIDAMKRLGMEVYISGPKEYQEPQYNYITFDEAIHTMDILMLLRVQKERHIDSNESDVSYFLNYGLTLDKVKMMRPHAIIMHPAPFNREVEIASDVVECSKSRIFKQMENGVYMRLAMIKRSLSK